MDIERFVPWINNPPRQTGDSGNPLNFRGTRDGAIGVASWKQLQYMEGRAFMVNIGAFSTPITGGGAGTVLDLDQPEGVLSVPANTILVPTRIRIELQTPLLATDADESEALIAVDTTAKWNSDGTYTSETPICMRTDNPRGGSVISCASAFTADMTNTSGVDPVLGLELAHTVIVGDVQGTAATALWTKNELLYVPDEGSYPFLVGPCALYLYWGGTVATTGFAQVEYIEIPATDLR